jgi:hypothetical protein
MSSPEDDDPVPPGLVLGLDVVGGEVGDAAGGWAAYRGVVAVMVVAVEPAVKGAGASGV